MSIESLLADLDSEQKEAATACFNAVVTAGAGSGKTKALASRYAWLVMEKGYKVDEILTLTFTNKVVNEMYSRIYSLLAEQQDNERAREAVEEFHKARILTLDAFSAAIARTASSRYGISPDFTSDLQGVQELALETALPFVLAHRDNPAIQAIIADRKIRTVAKELFADTVLLYCPISRPLDYNSFIQRQRDEILFQWNSKTVEMRQLINIMRRELENVTKKTVNLYINLYNVLGASPPEPPEPPDITPLFENTGSNQELRHRVGVYITWLQDLLAVSLSGKHSDEFTIIKESIKEARVLFAELGAFANTALQSGIIAELFPLIDEFRQDFNRQKRKAGILTFDDIAHLAVDALSQFPDIRKAYKDTCKSVMVDEFQDNNKLQRDLIFLLAENPDRDAEGIPLPEELRKDVMFFVGDEKQSIYRFRGADVSVFRTLADTLCPCGEKQGTLSLIRNYRSSPVLVDAFNRFFGGFAPIARTLSTGPDTDTPLPGAVFLPDDEDLPNYEAAYHRVYAREESIADAPQFPQVHFCFLDKDRLDRNNPGFPSDYELEAAYVAEQIRKMVEEDYKIRERKPGGIELRPCTYGDFVILQRSYAHQSILEKQCKNFGVPFNTDRPAGIFNDAPVNDLLMYLRLLVYPEDRLAYAALIRSPFMRLSDLTLSVCLLSSNAVPFDEALENDIPPEERELYRLARQRYRALAEAARTLPVTDLLLKLWYDEGYRYETLWSRTSQIYAELFDLFFEAARNMDSRGKDLADFLDYMDNLVSQEEKLDDLNLPPAEGSAGVRIMSIHKSKGLEFPVVFVYGCGSKKKTQSNSETVYFSEQWGISINLPHADELPGPFENYFFSLSREEEDMKETAELRRLLYVAMTRAESRLFLTASLPKSDKKEKDEQTGDGEYTVQSIKERLAYLNAKHSFNGLIHSFLDLILPPLVMAENENPVFTIEKIPIYTREEIRLAAHRSRSNRPVSMTEAAASAAQYYANAETITTPPPPLISVSASSLQSAGLYTPAESITAAAGGDKQAGDASLDGILSRAGLEAADFGTIVHSFLEGRFKGVTSQIPPRILARLEDRDVLLIRESAEHMAQGFFNSELGNLSLKGAYRESEFPIITLADTRTGKIPVSGQIDLLFESDGVMYITDFKTDRIEEPEHHLAQMAVYTRAVSDIFEKPVRTWLFYLRGSNAVEVTEQVQNIHIIVDPEK
ncbi:MAG: UvrD-helicase domain-containing protein [Treponema sp.]|jgi:ATP-dependent helicase/nuclease subunit A|nr:UvrD-helicase domain-containing protein [Treponema sp.]